MFALKYQTLIVFILFIVIQTYNCFSFYSMSCCPTLHPTRPLSHHRQLSMQCMPCMFSAVFVYHNSLFELEASTTVPTGKHQVLNAIPRHACLSNLRSNECHSSSPGGPLCHVSVYKPTLLLMAPPERFAQMCLLFPQSGSQSFRSGLVYQ